MSVSVQGRARVMAMAPTGRDRLLGSGATELGAHHRRHGPLPSYGPGGRLIAEVARAGLTGRGGAGFPTHLKLAEVAAGRDAVVVANGAEGEPASTKDGTLLAYAPHLVLDGLQLAAEAVGARRVDIYLRSSAAGGVRAALAERRSAGWDRLAVAVHVAPDTFISGEESAVVAAVSGRRAVPGDRLQRVGEAGVRGAPTLVQNVETLAHLGLIARYGAAWFRGLGTPDEPGTFLATIGGAVASPGVCELPYGVTLADAIAAAGGPTATPRSVLVGGFHGGWVPAIPDLPISRAGLATYEAAPGAGVLIALGADACGLAQAAGIVGYLAAETAGQCGPCVNGLPRLAELLAALARPGSDRRLPAEVNRLAGLVSGRGACRHPDGTARFVRSTLRAFADDVNAHRHGRCLARVAR
jgi:NADH:ubiquinone oxidoreductase subunit F (NADH-binding)